MKWKIKIAVLLACSVLVGCGNWSDSEQASAVKASSLSTGTMQVRSARVLGYMVAATDTATIAGYRDNFSVTHLDGTVTVTSKVNPTDVRVFQNIKLLKFADKYISYDVDGPSGQVFRLYQAAFNRVPDHGGLGFWVQMYENGALTIEQVAVEFSKSAEFKTLYGENISNEQFIKLVYNNVLHRDPDQAGYDFWVKAMVAYNLSREALLYNFSESAENTLNTQPATMNGFEYTPFRTNTIVPQASSYANKASALAAMGPQVNIGGANAFADFFSEGKYSMVVNSNVYDRNDARTQNQFGSITFYQNVNGRWVDNTSKLLQDTTGCLHPRKAVVADFNQDGKADLMLACHGFDAAPFPGEMQRVLLSQADGTYKNVNTGINCFCHGASAADVNGDNYPDILVADQMIEKTPYFLINNRDGTFTKDLTRLPNMHMKQIWTAELIVNAEGKYDAFLAGADQQGDGYQINPTIFRNNGEGKYLAVNKIEIPLVNSAVGYLGNGAVLDVTAQNGKVYMLRTFGYEAMAIQKTDLETGHSSEIYWHTGMYPKAGASWFSWFGFYNGKLVSAIADYEVSISD